MPLFDICCMNEKQLPCCHGAKGQKRKKKAASCRCVCIYLNAYSRRLCFSTVANNKSLSLSLQELWCCKKLNRSRLEIKENWGKKLSLEDLGGPEVLKVLTLFMSFLKITTYDLGTLRVILLEWESLATTVVLSLASYRYLKTSVKV